MPSRRPSPQARRERPGRVYNIGGGSRVSVNEVLAMIGRVSGKRLQVAVDPVQKGDMRHTYADTSLARAELGYRPAVGLEQGLAAESDGCRTSSDHDVSRVAAGFGAGRRGSGRVGVCADGPQQRPAGHGPARSIPVRARDRGVERQTVADRPESISSRSPRPIRRARSGRTPSSAWATPTSVKARRKRWSLRSTSSRSSSRSIPRIRAPTTPSTRSA